MSDYIRLFNKEKHYIGKPFTPDMKSGAMQLAYINRFTGCAGNYSVLKHSLFCYYLCLTKYPESYQEQMNCLLHDFTEVYLNDVAKPVKNLLPDYQKLENFYSDIIDKYYNVNTSSEIVKEVDLIALILEGYTIGPFVDEFLDEFDTLSKQAWIRVILSKLNTIVRQDVSECVEEFMNIYESLSYKIKDSDQKSL